MARLIKMTDDAWAELAADMVEDMKKKRAYQGEFEYKISTPKIERKAKIVFSQSAYVKMLSLIMTCDKEVGWYCTCTRGENDEYYIEDVLVFPQKVTAATVDSDDEKRTEWFDSLPVETLLKIKCDCHSHVNMSTSPSGTDDKDMRAVFDNIPDDQFRIFMIWNKKTEHYATIFDLWKNVVFDNSDITVEVEGIDIAEFISESHSMIDNKIIPSTYSCATYPTKGVTTSKANMKSKTKKEAKKQTETVDDDLEIDWDFYDEYEEYYLHDLVTQGILDDDDFDSIYSGKDRHGKYGGGYYGYGLY